ncbi:MAG: hypothetical protein FD123_2548 [Bacteroidetes bacterium]|nr:MAG: hypothetical protein FD123_2548 [Bacteroidota bacterium]
MSITKAITALTAEFDHQYFKTENKFRVNQSLLISPSAATAEILRGARMLFRQTPKGFTVMYASYPDPPDSTTNFVPFVELADDTDLTFVMNLSSKDRNEFMNYTKLNTGSPPPAVPTKEYSPSKVAYFTKSGTNAMDYDLLDSLRPDLFTFDFQVPSGDATTKVDITLQYEAETAVQIYDDLTNSNLVFSAQVDLRGKRKGKYTLVATPVFGPGTMLTTTFYVDKDLYGTDLFGIVKLPFKDSVYPPTPSAAPVYTYTFEKRITKWRYFLVLRNPAAVLSNPTFTISVVSGGSYNFPLAPTGITPGVLISGHGTAVITSTDYIPFSETIVKLRLDENFPTVKEIKVTMPNPKLDGFDSDRLTQLTTGTPQKNISEMFVFIDDI